GYEFSNSSGYATWISFDGTGGAPAVSGPLMEPRGIWANSAGTTVVVTDFQGQSVRVFQKQGNAFIPVFKLTQPLNFNYFPMGVTGDAAGNVYVVDLENIVWIYNGADFTQAPAQVNLTGISQSKYMAIDSLGNFYVTDTNNQYVVYNSNWAFKTSCGSANGISFNQPQGISVDASGNIFVGDQYNNRVVQMQPCVGMVFPTPTFTPTPTANCCQSGLVFNGTNHPQDLKVGGNYLYVGDSNNHQVAIYDKTSGAAPIAFIKNDINHPTLDFGSPSGVALDTEGHIFVCDFSSKKVYEFNNTTGYPLVTTFDGTGGAPAVSGPLVEPHSLWVNSAGTTVVVTDLMDSSIRVFALQSGSFIPIYKLFPTQFNYLFGPYGVTGDNAGNVYVVDVLENIVWIYNSAAFNNAPAQISLTGFNPGQQAKFMAVDNLGDYYVSATQGGYIVYNHNWTIKATCNGPIGSPFNELAGISVDWDGAVYTSDVFNNRVVQMQPCMGVIFPTPTPTSTATPVLASCATGNVLIVSQPYGLALDGMGNIYVADDSTGQVDVFNPSRTPIPAIGPGQPVPLVEPMGVAVDGNGSVYVTDESSNQVDVYSNSGAPIAQWGGTGAANGQFENPV
ncbi:MAG TPA: NHL repeat-containing protein, partial [bacterium]